LIVEQDPIGYEDITLEEYLDRIEQRIDHIEAILAALLAQIQTPCPIPKEQLN